MSNGRSRLISTLLVLSLALNLLLIGGIIGQRVSGPSPRPIPHHLGWMLRNLDDDRRQQLRSHFEAHASEARPLRREMRQAQREFERAVRAENFDPEAVRHALERLREGSGALQEAMHTQMVEVLGQLDEEERGELLQFLERRDRGPGRGGPRPGDHP